MCAVMLLNISITHIGTLKLNFKIGTLKEAQADYQPPVDSYNHWWLQNGDGASEKYFGWPSCYKKYGWFDDPVTCSHPQ